jgi:hypothetical protein
MSESALDVMADVLLNYLNRVGRTLAHLVEASGRTSAHVNILDALRACELVASPAVERLHIRDVDNDDEGLFAGTATARTNLSSDWQGLAAFLFGPKWMEDSQSGDDDSESKAEQQGNGAGGKVGPSATDELVQSKPKKLGWDAPYLDEVQPFPIASEKCANPHPLPPYVGLSLHRAHDEVDPQNDEANTGDDELDQIPDSVFISSWGSIQKRKADSLEEKQAATTASEDVTMTDAETPEGPRPKKVKISDAKASEENENETKDNEKQAERKTKLRIPSFYPAPPIIKSSTSLQGRTIVDTLPATREERGEEGSRAVRSSLVHLGSYWGSGWDDPNNSKNSAAATSMAVPLGRSDPGEQPLSTTLVVPLGRASGSRVSRILEGSMDAAAMQ